jgi:transglutaminase-like putative cysteine protease
MKNGYQKFRRAKIVFVLLLMISAAGLSAQPVPELIKTAGDQSAYPGHDQLVIFDSTIVDVRETGLTFVHNHTLTKVLTSHGAIDLSVVKFGYDPLSAWVEIRKVVVHKKSGAVIELDLKNVMDYPAPARAIYWGAREKMMEVGRLDPGDALEVVMFRKGFTYALLQTDEDEKYIPPMRGQFYDIVEFFYSQPVKSKVYQVSVPMDKPLQYEFYNGEAQTSCWFRDGRIVYTFSKKEMMPLKNESRMVATVDVAPKLLISTTPAWEAKSTWFYKVNEDFGSFDSTPEIKAKVDEILKGARDEMDSVSLLTHWVADEVRYSGISMGCGEGFTLHKGQMTFTDRCGVCKDKAGMLITMLRAAGFKSYPAMTMAGSRIDYIAADQFNHCVTVVKLRDGKYHLLDPTWVPFVRELWSSAEQQQQYLMGVPEGADLATTPVSDPENHYVKIDGASQLLADGTLKGRITITGEGQSDASLRGLFRYTNRTMWYQNVERELLKIWPQAKITQVKYTDPVDYLNYNMWVAIDFNIPEFAMVSSGTMMFVPLSANGIFRSFQPQLSFETNLKERKYPFRDRCSRTVEFNESVILPAFKKITKLPAGVKKEGETVSFQAGYRGTSEAVIFAGKAVYPKRLYEAKDWPSYKAAVEAQNKFAEQYVIVEL